MQANPDEVITEEQARKYMGVLYDDDAKKIFDECRRGSIHARKGSLVERTTKDGSRISERGYIFFGNLKQLKECREHIEAIANELLPEGRVAAIEWIGKAAVLKQSATTLSGVYELAAAAKDAYAAVVSSALAKANVDTSVFTCADLKSKLRAQEKADNEYGGDCSRLVDIVRGMCVFESEREMADFYDALAENGDVDIVRVKNRFNPPNFNGYRDLLLNIRVSSFVCELQIHLKQIKKSDELVKSHKAYEYFRAYFMGNMDAVKQRLDALLKLPVEGLSTVAELVDRVMEDPEDHDLESVLALLDWRSAWRHLRETTLAS